MRTLGRTLGRKAVKRFLSLRTAAGRALSRRRLDARLAPGARVQLGCGPNRFEGWVNVDFDRSYQAEMTLDLRVGFPAPAASVSFIYSEHVLEHFTLDDAARILRDCRQALRPGGVMRIAMPDLASLVQYYLGDWRDQAWLQDAVYAEIDTAARMLNYALREWGHRYVYDRADLEKRLVDAGFVKVEARNWGESPFRDLAGRETRRDSTLIVEAFAP